MRGEAAVRKNAGPPSRAILRFMAEKTMLVCDVCGKPATQSVTFKVDGRNRVKGFCEQHLSELLKGSRAPRAWPSGSNRDQVACAKAACDSEAHQRRQDSMSYLELFWTSLGH
jgi:hypothetical protein